MTAALLAAESGLHETYLATRSPPAVLAAALYWVAARLRRRARPAAARAAAPDARRRLWHSLLHESAVVRGAAIPLVARPDRRRGRGAEPRNGRHDRDLERGREHRRASS